MVAPNEQKVETLEEGNVYFIYRPKVNEDEAEDLEDVQRLYMVLRPHGHKIYRMLTIGRKKLPDPAASGRQKHWAFVEAVSEDPKKIEHAFDPERYPTKTRGEQELPPGRPVGEGVYQIVRHGDHTHFVYALELPKKPGRPQREINLEYEASYIISVKNPERGTPQAPGLASDRQASFPSNLQDQFRDRKFVPVNPPDFLDHEGAEILLIAAEEDVQAELGITLDPQRETADTAEVFDDLRMQRSQHPTKPLLKGEWE